MTDYEQLVKALRDTERVCRDRMDGQVMLDAAAAIEALQAQMPKRGEECGPVHYWMPIEPPKEDE